MDSPAYQCSHLDKYIEMSQMCSRRWLHWDRCWTRIHRDLHCSCARALLKDRHKCILMSHEECRKHSTRRVTVRIHQFVSRNNFLYNQEDNYKWNVYPLVYTLRYFCTAMRNTRCTANTRWSSGTRHLYNGRNKLTFPFFFSILIKPKGMNYRKILNLDWIGNWNWIFPIYHLQKHILFVLREAVGNRADRERKA